MSRSVLFLLLFVLVLVCLSRSEQITFESVNSRIWLGYCLNSQVPNNRKFDTEILNICSIRLAKLIGTVYLQEERTIINWNIRLKGNIDVIRYTCDNDVNTLITSAIF